MSLEGDFKFQGAHGWAGLCSPWDPEPAEPAWALETTATASSQMTVVSSCLVWVDLSHSKTCQPPWLSFRQHPLVFLDSFICSPETVPLKSPEKSGRWCARASYVVPLPQLTCSHLIGLARWINSITHVRVCSYKRMAKSMLSVPQSDHTSRKCPYK